MEQISAQMVRQLRDMSGAGMMDCKNALKESGGNLDKAIEYLRKKGLKKVEKRSSKIAAEGMVFSYIHPGSRIGVMLEMNCETDFVARGDDFKNLAKDIAMHIAWANPKFISREEVPAAQLEKEKEILLSQLKPEQKKMADKIIPGKLEKYYEGACLLDQIDVRDSSGKKKISALINEVSVKVGEKILPRRFVRYELAEGIEKEVVDYAAEVAQAANL